MPDDVTVTPEVAAPPAAPLGSTPPPAPAAPPSVEPKTATVPTDTFKKLKEAAYARGQKEAREVMAKEAGFDTHEEMVEALKALKEAPPSTAAAAAAPAPATTPDDAAAAKAAARQAGKEARGLATAITERDRYARLYSETSRKERDARAAVDELKAEMHLRTLAARAGVQDIDYAVHLFAQKVDGLKPEEAEKFDEASFFQGLKKTHPYLYGESVQPATTGTGTGSPAAPAPGATAANAAAGAKTDATKLSPQAYRELLRSRGLGNPGA